MKFLYLVCNSEERNIGKLTKDRVRVIFSFGLVLEVPEYVRPEDDGETGVENAEKGKDRH